MEFLYLVEIIFAHRTAEHEDTSKGEEGAQWLAVSLGIARLNSDQENK